MNCAKCGKFEALIIASRLRLSGARYRRYACQRCSHRWTVYQDGAAAPREPKKTLDYAPKHVNRKLTSYEAAEIMMSDLSFRELALKYGISHQTVSDIKRGRSYRELYDALHPH